LHFAYNNKSDECVDYLISIGLNPNQEALNKKTPQEVAPQEVEEIVSNKISVSQLFSDFILPSSTNGVGLLVLLGQEQ